WAGLARWTGEIEKHVESTEESVLVQAVKSKIAAYTARSKALTEENHASAEPDPWSTRLLEDAYDAIEKVVTVNRDQASEIQEEAARRDRLANVLGILVVALLTVLIPGILLWVRSFVYLPLIRIRTALSRFGSGESEARAPATGPVELREMAEVFNR